ncbi:EscU/YscU/HrcU family type III secretion system export apparatus switch protein [Roseomonas xinghualingensis]|uniref:EscU/YscU/HrcU family type III secretion system export apparatus switch protein n=1 Tax=Roseomonas xinghualingensis TaxID=2986475 RepID=UPI0021F14C8E|nr:flagellar type III secretion system protein FlhB [Roseomonas sp. SXEYE001]MCV4208046.1 flagellar type III secretion system protein FlhB [Roseomonas sp. SXEYE001]
MAEENGQDAEDRTEAPSTRRLEKAREEGQVANSREASGFVALLLAVLAAGMALPSMGRDLLRALRGILERGHELSVERALEVLMPSALVLLPVLGAAALGAVATTLLQTRGLVSAKGLAPQLSRLSPMAGVKRILGVEALTEFLKTLLKIGLVGGAIWHAGGAPALLEAVMHQPAAALLGVVAEQGMRLMAATLAAFALLAAADLFLVRFRHLRRLRMSRQDMKEEAKDTDGDPHVKAKQRAIRQQKARQRMLAAVPKAAVVITNPTHYAVALGYEDGSAEAPKILAKGADEVAARIREAAREAGVPLVSNPPLARALFRLEVDTEIPAEHYQAVAEIIAFIWRARARPPA